MKTSNIILLASLLAALISSSANAQNLTWTGGNGTNWNELERLSKLEPCLCAGERKRYRDADFYYGWTRKHQ